MYAAISNLPDGHSHCIALQTLPLDASIGKAVQLFLRCFLVGDPMNITLPALLWERDVTVTYDEDDELFTDEI